MNSTLFNSDEYLRIAEKTLTLLNNRRDFLSENTIKSTRAVGDTLQDILAEHFGTLLGDYCTDYSANFARRAMADLAFRDNDDNYYVVDVKTHREDTKFNMPNLTSVERLARFYEDDSNYFVLLLIRYCIEQTSIQVKHVDFVPIEFLDWECLTIGALGWGQIQIANSNKIALNPHTLRIQWMIALCDTLLEFYPKEMGKIQERIEYFEKVKSRWEKRKQ